MANSEIISALNSLCVCLESKLLITNQIVEEFKSSMDSHFASLQHNKFSHGFSSPLSLSSLPSLSHPHGHPPPTDSLHHSTNISSLLKSGFCEPIKTTPLIYVLPSPPPIPSPNSILIPNSDASVEIVENDSWLDYVETQVVENVVVENMEEVSDSKLETKFIEVSAGERGYKMDMNDTHFVLQFESIRKGRIGPLNAKFVENFSRCFALVLEEKSTFVGGISSIVVQRRGVVLTIYALEEVYKEFLSLHLEDKVVLKGRRVDTIMNYIIGSSYLISNWVFICLIGLSVKPIVIVIC